MMHLELLKLMIRKRLQNKKILLQVKLLPKLIMIKKPLMQNKNVPSHHPLNANHTWFKLKTDYNNLKELEVSHLTKIFLEDASKNGISLKQMEAIKLQNQILPSLLQKKLKLKDLLNNLNGTTITGTWVETNTMIEFKPSSHPIKKIQLKLNKKLNLSLSTQLILQLRCLSNKQTLPKETLSNLLKLKLNSMLSSQKLMLLRLKLIKIESFQKKFKLMPLSKLKQKKLLMKRKSQMLKSLKTKKDLISKRLSMPEKKLIKKELIDLIERDSNMLRRLEMNKKINMMLSTLNSNLLPNKWHMPKKEDSIGANKVSRPLMMSFGLQTCHCTFNLKLIQQLELP